MSVETFSASAVNWQSTSAQRRMYYNMYFNTSSNVRNSIRQVVTFLCQYFLFDVDNFSLLLIAFMMLDILARNHNLLFYCCHFTAPNYFSNDFVKPRSVLLCFGTHVL